MSELTYMLLSLLGFAVAIAILSAVTIRVFNRYWPELSYIDDRNEAYDDGYNRGFDDGWGDGYSEAIVQANRNLKYTITSIDGKHSMVLNLSPEPEIVDVPFYSRKH